MSPGCVNCYAEARNQRFAKGENWGKGKPRRRTSRANWKKPLRWNRDAEREQKAVARCSNCGYLTDDSRALSGCKGYCQDSSGDSCDALPCPKCAKLHYWCGSFNPARRPRVFCASLADWLDDEVPVEWLADLLELVLATPFLDWQLLTKRPENWAVRSLAARLYFAGYRDGQTSDKPTARASAFYPEMSLWSRGEWWPSNIWVGTSVEDQARAELRIPALLEIPAKVRFLSCEPLLGPVDLRFARDAEEFDVIPGGWSMFGDEPVARVDWVIVGGESGKGARPMRREWAEGLLEQGVEAEVPFLFKQWGEHDEIGERVGKKKAGRLLGRFLHNEFPKVEGGAE